MIVHPTEEIIDRYRKKLAEYEHVRPTKAFVDKASVYQMGLPLFTK